MFSGQFPFKIPDKFWTNSGQKPDKNWFWTNSECWKMNPFWNNFWTFSFWNLSGICLDNFPAIFQTFSGHLFFIGLNGAICLSTAERQSIASKARRNLGIIEEQMEKKPDIMGLLKQDEKLLSYCIPSHHVSCVVT